MRIFVVSILCLNPEINIGGCASRHRWESTRRGDARRQVLSLLSEHKQGLSDVVVEEARLAKKAVEGALYRLWRD